MLKIKFDGLKALQDATDDIIKHHIPKMTAKTLTATAKGFKAFIEGKLPSIFDRPTRWTLNSVYYLSASPKDLNAYVWFKDETAVSKGTPASKYLWPEVHGGPRRLKRYEVALQRFGVLPSGYYTVPGKGVKLDGYGNIPSGTITEMLTGVGALVGMSDTVFYGVLGGYKKRKRTTANYFIVRKPTGGLVPGIWERYAEKGSGIRGMKAPVTRQKGERKGKFYSVIQARGVRPILIFVKAAPQYQVRLPFYIWAEEYVNRELPLNWDRIAAAETLAYWRSK